MGLDMYLYKKTYIRNSEYRNDSKWEISVKRGGEQVGKAVFNPEQAVYLIEEVAYWRKANAIHNWFDMQVDGGVENCVDAPVSRASIEELLQLVNKVIKASTLNKENEIIDPSTAKEILPCVEGFFFGETTYDDWYLEKLQDTKGMLENALADPEADEFVYRAWW